MVIGSYLLRTLIFIFYKDCHSPLPTIRRFCNSPNSEKTFVRPAFTLYRSIRGQGLKIPSLYFQESVCKNTETKMLSLTSRLSCLPPRNPPSAQRPRSQVVVPTRLGWEDPPTVHQRYKTPSFTPDLPSVALKMYQLKFSVSVVMFNEVLVIQSPVKF